MDKNIIASKVPTKEEVKPYMYKPAGDFNFEKKSDGLYVTFYKSGEAADSFSRLFHERFDVDDVGNTGMGSRQYRITKKVAMDKKMVAAELIAVAKLLAASEKVAMPLGMDNQVHALLDAAKKSGTIVDRLVKSFAPMGRVLRDSVLEGPTAAAIDAMEDARDALGKLIGVCNSELVEHETAFMSSEKE